MRKQPVLPLAQVPERLLLVRLSAIGDIVFASPLIEALRSRDSRAHLAWLVQPACAPLLRHHPGLDEVIEWPQPELRALFARRRLAALGRELAGLGAGLRARRFELAVDLQGLLKSALPTRLTNAPERIGLNAREGSGLLMTRVFRAPRDDPRIGSEYRALAQALGLATADFRLRIYPGDVARAEALRMVARERLESGFIVLCPFTTRAHKHWFEDRWAALARGLGAPLAQGGLGLPARLLGAPADRAAAARIAQVAGLPLAGWVGETSLPQAAALIERASLLIGVDTGLAHMGLAAETPTLLLFGATRPYLDPGCDKAQVLYHPRPCSPCRRRPSCDGRFDCMRAIEVEPVRVAARALVRGAR